MFNLGMEEGKKKIVGPCSQSLPSAILYGSTGSWQAEVKGIYSSQVVMNKQEKDDRSHMN